MDRLRAYADGLNERERKLLGALGVVFALIVVLLPIYLVTSSISEIEEENRQISQVLRDIGRARGTLAQRQAEREAARARYQQAAPPLGSFLEARATEQELSLREVTDQPEKVVGDFRRRNVRATLPSVGLRKVIKLLTSIENSRFPVAVERIQIEHFRSGEDSYNVQIGVIAYDAEETEEPASSMRGEASSMRAGRAGPPAP
ncbi:MAG: type II secretion system protein GspM [Polyangiales bacterium]|nr:type II secretion system protein M [Myxococcales bacterium]MCB9621830.1 type II secretion system protein M [Sandaracinus sp.]